MQQTRTSTRRIRRGLGVSLAVAVSAASVLVGESTAFAAGGDTTLSEVDSDFQAGATSIVLDADIDDTQSQAAVLTLSLNIGPTATTTLDLNGHTLGVKALLLTTFPNGSPQGANLRIVDTYGGGVLRVKQSSTTRPAIEVDSGSSLNVLSGSVDASNSTSSTAAVVGGGPVADPVQVSGSITTNGSGSLTATGSGSGAAIGSGDGAPASGALTFGGSSHVVAVTSGRGAAIGDGNGAAAAAIMIANQAQVSASQNGTGITGAAIGGGASPTGQTAGSVTIGDDAQLTAASTGAGAAVGGGYHGDGGQISATGYSHITATGAQAAIGDGEHSTGGGSSVSLSGQGVVVDAHGGTGSSGGAGIGGGSTAYGNDTLVVGGGASVNAHSDNGPGIGGLGNTVGTSVSIDNATVTATGGGAGAAIGAGSPTSIGSSVSIGTGGTVTVRSNGSTIGGNTVARFGSLSNSGTLVLPGGQSLVIPVNATASNDGVIANSGSITATGLLTNSGSIVNVTGGSVSGSVSGNNYRVVYDAQSGTGSTTQFVYTPSIAKAQLTVPSATPASAGAFTSWNTQTDGTGSNLSATSALADLAGGGSSDGSVQTLRLYALYQLNPVLPGSGGLPQAVVGTPYSASVAATAGTAPISYDATGIPAGLSFSNGVISGTPTTAGSFTVHVSASNGAGSSTGTYTVSVVSAPITLSVPSTSKGTKRYLAGGTATLSIGGLQANETYKVTIGSRTVATGKAASNSVFTKKVTIPKTIGDGAQTVKVTGTGHATGVTAKILTASVSKKLGVKLSTKKVKAKKKVTITVSKLYAGESVRVVIKGKHSKTAVGKATSKGVYVLKLKSGLAKGKYKVTITGAGTSRKATVKLTVH